MKNLQIQTNPAVEQVFNNYPIKVRKKIVRLRKLILEAAAAIESIGNIEETLKWNEPSYIAKKGSTIRIDWKKKEPDQYAIYFKCTSKLLPTFKAVYGNLFTYEGTRAIVFKMTDAVPEAALKKCISAALTYHTVKHLPLLGL